MWRYQAHASRTIRRIQNESHMTHIHTTTAHHLPRARNYFLSASTMVCCRAERTTDSTIRLVPHVRRSLPCRVRSSTSFVDCRIPHPMQLAPFHSRSSLQHGRHKHDEHDEDDEDESDVHSAPVLPEEKARMERECTDITMRGVYANIALAIFKFVGGVFGNSMAMIADAVHSLSDLVTDGITLWAARLTHKPQDADHPYGHGKFEAIGSLTISATLAATAGGIGWSAIESIQKIMSGEALAVPTGIALVAAIVSIAVKEALYHQTMRVGTRWSSKVVKANAWHHRSDSVSTLVAMVGVVGAMVKLPILDPVAGLFVSGLILKAAVELGWDSLRDLTDENVDEKLQSDVASILHSMKDEGVQSFHRLRGRAMGPFVLMDVHISVSPTISVSAAHQIAERARIRVRQKLPVVAELLVHVDVAQCDHSLFEDMPSEDEQREHEDTHDPHGEPQIFNAKHIQEVVQEYRQSRAQVASLTASANHPSAIPPVPVKSPLTPGHSVKESVKSGLKHLIGKPDVPVASPPSSHLHGNKSVASTPSGKEPGPLPLFDLSHLMRPQALVEKDVRKVLADPHATYARMLKGVSHFTCHWNPERKQMRVQLELAFHHSSSLTIDQARTIAKGIEASILDSIKDVHAVDIHLELTEDHIRDVKHVHVPKELPPTVSQ